MTTSENNISVLETATFGGGCFWCTEAVFKELAGVVSVTSGYAGGHLDKPTYREVCSGTTGHAEAVQVQFDPAQLSFERLLQVFFVTHDPTTLNRQGNDTGTQYRSVIFYHNELQRQIAIQIIARLNESGAYADPVVTEVTPFTNFFPAEAYHQDYFELHGREPYCQVVIRPKLEKFRHAFPGQLKKS